MNYRAKQIRVLYILFFLSFLSLSSVTFAAPVSQNDEPTIDSSNIPIDTDVTRSEALKIAERVLGSSVTLGTPRLHTEEDGQVMWQISYETEDGDMNEIIINTVTGAYRLVLEDENDDVIETTATTDIDTGTSNDGGDTSMVSTTTTVSATLESTTTASTFQEQIIELLEQIIQMLRTQLTE